MVEHRTVANTVEIMILVMSCGLTLQSSRPDASGGSNRLPGIVGRMFPINGSSPRMPPFRQYELR